MSAVLTEASSFDATITTPEPGDDASADTAVAGNVQSLAQKVVNRTRYLYDLLTGALGSTRLFKQLAVDLTATAGDAAAALAADVAASVKAAAGKVLTFSANDGLTITFAGGTIVLYPGGASTFSSGSEIDINSAAGDISVHKGGLLAFTSVTTGSNGSNPDRTVNIPNQLRAAMLPKGWGNVITAGGGVITGTGAGGWIPTIVGTAIRVTFSGTITQPCLLLLPAAANVKTVSFTSGLAYVDVTCYSDFAGTVIDPAIAIVSFNFLMMGKMTT